MKPHAFLGLACLLVVACGTSSNTSAPPAYDPPPPYDPHPVTPAWLSDARVLVSGHGLEGQRDCRGKICRHNENVDMISWAGAIYMVHRTARSQILGDNSALHVYRSTDGGETFADLATLPAIVGRDLRDPAFFVVGDTLKLKALTRLPVNSARDSDVHSQTVIAESKDGAVWSAFENVAPEQYSFWRPKEHAGTYYAGAYADGDANLTLWNSPDGKAWTKGAAIYDVAADTPLEPELVFMPTGKLMAFFRMDGTDQELLAAEGRLRTGVCWADAPYTKFDCSQVLSPYRLDGPVSFFWKSRLFVLARKHLQDRTDRKRTSLFEMTGDMKGGPLAIKEWGELPSAGDTAYAGMAMIDDHRAVTHWYAGDLERDEAWVLAMFNVTDIWRGVIDLDKLGQ